MMARLVEALPSGRWLYELKFGVYRALANEKSLINPVGDFRFNSSCYLSAELRANLVCQPLGESLGQDPAPLDSGFQLESHQF